VSTIGIILPVFNEEGGIEHFHNILSSELKILVDDFSFIYVNDGSSDGSLEILKRIRENDGRVHVITLSKNFGHQIAVTAGLDYGDLLDLDAVAIMDTDLQDPPHVLIEMIEKWKTGVDVVYAERRSRKDTFFKKTTAKIFYKTLSTVAESPIPQNVGDFRILDKKVLTELIKYREKDRFLRGIIANLGFKQEPVLFDRDERYAGETHYPLKKMLKLAADGIFGFSTLPLRFITRIGVLVSIFSVLLAVYALLAKLITPETTVPGWAFLGVGMFFLGGIQLITLGIIGEYVGRTYIQSLDRPLYSIEKIYKTDQ
jgi:dolichol-phosphate mannosyltransferase